MDEAGPVALQLDVAPGQVKDGVLAPAGPEGEEDNRPHRLLELTRDARHLFKAQQVIADILLALEPERGDLLDEPVSLGAPERCPQIGHLSIDGRVLAPLPPALGPVPLKVPALHRLGLELAENILYVLELLKNALRMPTPEGVAVIAADVRNNHFLHLNSLKKSP